MEPTTQGQAMSALAHGYLNRAGLALIITILAYFLLNGAQVFETAVLVPKWTAKPPASLSVLQGLHAPDLKTFWIVAHSIHEITFLIAIVFCWQLPAIRNTLLLILMLHVAVRVWTIVYFAPNIMTLQKADTDLASPELLAAVGRWRSLNYVRVTAFVGLSIWTAGLLANFQREPLLNQSTPKQFTSMDQRFSVITLGVDNLPAQLAFYKTKLGWESVAENKTIVFFKMNGFLFSLLDRKALAEGSGVQAEGQGFRSITLSYNVSSTEQVDQLHEQFKANGITILKAPTDTPFGGYYFTFADLENNVLEVAYNPYIPQDDTGNMLTHYNIDNL
ncbi:VOC family protein [Salmonirosea aquatica]|uniref:VOC family protein n=1 Tax=Salmonirosea aquatica TaxID=2654236 RepID=UPI003570B3B4